MSERSILASFVLCLVLAAPAKGQDLAQLKRREVELQAQLEHLRAATADSAEGVFWRQRRTVASDGGLVVSYPEDVMVRNADRVAGIFADQRRRYGIAIDSLLTDTLYGGLVEHRGANGRPIPGAEWRLGARHGEQAAGGEWMASTITTALHYWAEDLLDPRLRAWLGPLDARANIATLRDPLVRDLVGSRSSRAHRCLGGVADECRLLLELDEGDLPILTAYDIADLPTVFLKMELSDQIPGKANCVGKRDPSACVELIRRGAALPPHPISARARQSLFAYALASGGEQAWLRLHRARGRPVAEQLSIAAGRPVEELLGSWQRDLVGGRKTVTAGLGPSFLLALFWGVAATLFFAWRYRWRHV